jgi:hypothetical protein
MVTNVLNLLRSSAVEDAIKSVVEFEDSIKAVQEFKSQM